MLSYLDSKKEFLYCRPYGMDLVVDRSAWNALSNMPLQKNFNQYRFIAQSCDPWNMLETHLTRQNKFCLLFVVKLIEIRFAAFQYIWQKDKVEMKSTSFKLYVNSDVLL